MIDLARVNQEYKYEVAFSFLQDDEQLALEIADRVRDRVSVRVFVYSERQDTLVGNDGVDAFSRVFGEDSRIVLILHRKGWGETKWTRVEENAVRTRGFNYGHEFVLLVKLDKSEPPVWLPPTRIYLGFERWGIDGVAGVIESRVQSIGGVVSSETILERAAIIGRRIDFRDERIQWRRSVKAVEAAKQEVMSLFEELKKHAEEVNTQIKQVQISYSKSGKNSCDLSIGWSGFNVRWYNSFSDALEESGLLFEIWETARFIDDRVVVRNQTHSVTYNFDLDSTRNVGWRTSEEDRFFTTRQLAEYWIKKLLNMADLNTGLTS